jgi:hypothetical protein
LVISKREDFVARKLRVLAVVSLEFAETRTKLIAKYN